MLERLLAAGLCPEKSLRLARALHRARRWRAARQLLERLPGREHDFRVALELGLLAFDAQDYPRALAHLRAARRLARRPEQVERAWFYLSRTLGRLDRDREAVHSHLQMVARYPRGRRADRALYYAGWLLRNDGDCPGAVRLFTRLQREYPRSRWLAEARWFTALCQLRRGHWSQALETLRPQWRAADPEVAARAVYWSVRAARQNGRRRLAERLLTRLADHHPLSWYGLLAAMQPGWRFTLPPRRDLGPPRPRQHPRLERILVLSRTGLESWARALLKDAWRRAGERHNRAWRLAVADASRRAGDCHLAWRLAGELGAAAVRGLPDPDEVPLWQAAWPDCYLETVRRQAGNDELALFLLSIMRTESGFDPAAQSVADARGLLQLIDEVARPAARALGLEYHPDRLFEPGYNIRLAAWHLGRLLERYRDNFWLAAAAYNAGAAAVDHWLEEFGDLPADLFAELIPWTETRRYFKRVLTAWAHYAFLRGGPMPMPSLDPPARAHP